MTLAELERRKFAALKKAARPRKPRVALPGTRYVPASIRRAVWERDGGQCSFVSSETGRRCSERGRLEFDHRREFARGGEATVDGIRLLCRADNQHAAERTFGAGFMSAKREEAAAKARARQSARAAAA